jgi:hypothetical protein
MLTTREIPTDRAFDVSISVVWCPGFLRSPCRFCRKYSTGLARTQTLRPFYSLTDTEPSSMPKMAEKGRRSNGAIGSRWKSAQRPEMPLCSLPPGRPRSPLVIVRADRRMSHRKPSAALRLGAMYPHAGGDGPLIAPFRGRTDGSGQAKVDILLEPVRRAFAWRRLVTTAANRRKAGCKAL